MEILNNSWVQIILVSVLVVIGVEWYLAKNYSEIDVSRKTVSDPDGCSEARDIGINSKSATVRKNTRATYITILLLISLYILITPFKLA